jgi:DNA-binding IclR family transcriptional regulator
MNHAPIITGRALGYRAVQVLGYVRATIAAEGQAPSYGMIAEELGVSSRAKVHEIVKRLERRGLLRRSGSGRVRRIRLG